MILPSLLQYSIESLDAKLKRIANNTFMFEEITHQGSKMELHLDFVLQQFAKDRSVMMSLSPKSVLTRLHSCWADTQIEVSIHLMGDQSDLASAYAFFDSYEYNPNWGYRLYVPEAQLRYFAGMAAHKKLVNNSINVEVGAWYDLDEWEYRSYFHDHNLLMTVPAGVSGQMRLQESKDRAIELARRFPKSHFIVDGGWSIKEYDTPANMDVVSHSSFWGAFEK